MHSMKGRNLDFIICALIYISGTKHNNALDIKIFGKEYEKDIRGYIKFIEELMNDKTIIKDPEKEVYKDVLLDSYVTKYSKSVYGLNRRLIADIRKLIPMTQFIMRKKEIVAVALIVYYKNDTSLIKKLSKEYCLSDISIRSAIRELKEISVKT